MFYIGKGKLHKVLCGLILILFPMLLQDVFGRRKEHILWDMETLSKSPKVKSMERTVKGKTFLFESVPHKNRKSSVYAYYSNPDLLVGSESTRVFPTVLLIHGGSGRVYTEWVEKWAGEGYAAIAIDFIGERWKWK